MEYKITDGKEREFNVQIPEELIKTAALDPDIDWNVVMRNCREQFYRTTVRAKPEPHTAEEQIIRAAILDVIDSGFHPSNPKGLGKGTQWRFYTHPCSDHVLSEDQVNEDRCNFADRVISRARELKYHDEQRSGLGFLGAAVNAHQNAAKAWDEVGAYAEHYRQLPTTNNAETYMGLVSKAIRATGQAESYTRATIPEGIGRPNAQVWSDINAIQRGVVGCEYEKIARLHRGIAKLIYSSKVGAA